MPKTDEERRDFLGKIGLNPDAPALDPLPVRPSGEGRAAAASEVMLAPPGVDPRTMPVSDIVFDKRLVEQFPSLAPKDRKAAADYVFALYKSPGRGGAWSDRNKLLWAEIGKWLVRLQREREHGVETAPVQDKVRRGKKERDLLAVLKELGVESVDDLKGLMEGSEE